MFKSVGIEPDNLADQVLRTIPESYYAISDWFCDNNNDLAIPPIPGTDAKLTFSGEGRNQPVYFNVGSCARICRDKLAGVDGNSITSENSKTESVRYHASESMCRDDFEIVVQFTNENTVQLSLSGLNQFREIDQSLFSKVWNKKYLIEVVNWSTQILLNDKQASFVLAQILQARSLNKDFKKIISYAETALDQSLSNHAISL